MNGTSASRHRSTRQRTVKAGLSGWAPVWAVWFMRVLVGLLTVPTVVAGFLIVQGLGAGEDTTAGVGLVFGSVIVAAVLVVLVPCVCFLRWGSRGWFWAGTVLWLVGMPLWSLTATALVGTFTSP